MNGSRQRATFYELQAANRLNSFLLLFGFFALVLVLGLGLDVFFLGWTPAGDGGIAFPLATPFALLGGAIHAAVSWFGGAGQVLASTGATPADPSDPLEKQFLNVVDEMSIAAGIRPPKAYVVPDPDPNAFAVGRDPEHAAVAVTRGLLETLDRDELQGVISHEIAHIRNLDIRAMTLVTALFGAVALLSDTARRGVYYGRGAGHGASGRGRSRDSGGGGGGGMALLFLIWIVFALVAPFVARLLALAVSRSREYLADASGAELTRNPLGLASALRKLGAAREPTRVITQGSAHLCITDPRGLKLNERDGEVAELFGTHPPLAKRIALLEGMAGVVGGPEGAPGAGLPD